MQFEINTIEELCTYINVPVNFLKYVLFVKNDNYFSFNILKRNGSIRQINAPRKELKYIQRQLLKFLEDNYNFFDCQHGFIKGRSCVTNAKCHVGKRFVLNGDIEDFFDNIHFGRVRGLFMNEPFNYSNRVATIIAKIACHNRKLPQGAPTSPIISNMICYTMDRELSFIAKKNNCKYTRYADDITFSTDAESFPNEIAEVKDGKIYFSDRVIKIVNGGYENGFIFNNKKTRFYRRFVRQEVTGIIVNRKTNVDHQYIRQLRAVLHNISKNGFIDSYAKTFKKNTADELYAKRALFNYTSGKIGYLKMVKGDTDGLYLKYANEFNEVFNTKTFDTNDEARILKYALKRCYVVDCEYYTGTGFSIKDNSIFTSTHVILNKANFSTFKFNCDADEFEKQFPICDSNGPFILLKHPDLKREKMISTYEITKSNYESDIITLKVSLDNKNKMRLAQKKVQEGDFVYMLGYPAFNGFDKTKLHIQKATVIGENTYLGRNLINTDISPKHGMSGGPVLNENCEVVGIVYAGFDDGGSENVGFISLI